MPQATDELRAKIVARFGSIDCGPVVDWLRARGFTLTPDWLWDLPVSRATNGSMNLTDEECDAINFLVDEWDFGGVIPPNKD